MAPEISLDNQRKADLKIFTQHVDTEMSRIEAEAKAKKAAVTAQVAAE
jgi:hypothetical protein